MKRVEWEIETPEGKIIRDIFKKIKTKLNCPYCKKELTCKYNEVDELLSICKMYHYK